MPDFSDLPTRMFEPGQALLADDLNKLANASRRVSIAPNTFQNGAMTLTAIGGQASGVTAMAVIITVTVGAASWDSGELKLTPELDEANVFELIEHEDGDGGYTYDPENPVATYNYFTTPITVSSGKARIGQVVSGRFYNVDCNEIELES